MEKLIVKNFGPIKEAEIDLTKYVVFIGDTSTGKSVLAKLIAIFRDAFTSLSTIKNQNDIAIRSLLIKYNIDFDIQNSEMIYYADNIKLLELISGSIHLIDFDLKQKVVNQFDNHVDTASKESLFANYIRFDKDEFYNYIMNDYLSKVGTIYFPAERNLISLTGNALSGLAANNVAIPECYKEFAAKYEVARSSLEYLESKVFDIEYRFSKKGDEIRQNGFSLLLSQASSGLQSLIPLFLVFEYEMKRNNDDFMRTSIFEEPEMNLFPVKQKLLIEYIVSKVYKRKEKIIFTTHSPYILSVLDTLILAKNTFNENPKLKNEIEEVIKEDRWIDYNDISVYEVKNDGTIQSIKNEEFKSIDTNAIDRVSDIISEEFDKLTELRYAQ